MKPVSADFRVSDVQLSSSMSSSHYQFCTTMVVLLAPYCHTNLLTTLLPPTPHLCDFHCMSCFNCQPLEWFSNGSYCDLRSACWDSLEPSQPDFSFHHLGVVQTHDVRYLEPISTICSTCVKHQTHPFNCNKLSPIIRHKRSNMTVCLDYAWFWYVKAIRRTHHVVS